MRSVSFIFHDFTHWPEGMAVAAVVMEGAPDDLGSALKKLRGSQGPVSAAPVVILPAGELGGLLEEEWATGVDVLPPGSPRALERKLRFFVDFFLRASRFCSFYRDEPPKLDLSQSEFLDSLIENLPNMVFVKDAQDLRFVRFNRAGEDLLGIARSELIGRNDFDFFPQQQAEFFVGKDRSVLAGQSIVEIPEEVIQTRAKGERVLRTKKIPLFTAEGKPAYLLGISEDITELKEKERDRLRLIREQAVLEEREAANQRMMFLAEASMILASSFDYRRSLSMLADMMVPFFSDWCAIYLIGEGEREQLVTRKGDLLHEAVAKLTGENTHDKRRERFFGDIAHGKERSLLIPENAAAGVQSFLAVPIQVRGQVLGLFQFATHELGRILRAEDLSMAEELGRRAGIALDNAQLYETAQKAIQTRDEFLSIASHELKTPMTSLKLQVQMTRRMVDPVENKVPSAARLAKVLDISAVQVDRLTALVDDLLDVSRIESGKLTYEFEPVELGFLVREMVDRYFDHLRSAGCQVTVDVSELVWVKGDRFRLEQVVLNLLSNAAKYGRAQPVEVRVYAEGGRARLVMKDHGIGIAPAMIEKVFERFERASSAGNIGGLGLGLYISREIIRAHGGSIRIESELGQGSVFVVDIPEAMRNQASQDLFSQPEKRNSYNYLSSRARQEERPAP
jgi:PAS domain S-box-containing protein